MNKDDAQYEKAKDERTNIQTELFLAIRSVYARLSIRWATPRPAIPN